PVYSPKKPVDPEASAPVPFRVIASGRLASEKDQITLIKAVSMSKHAGGIQLIIAGTGPLEQYLRFRAGRLLARKADIGFHKHADMP
ncbi:glycosyl transferase, partial [Bifidobacterium animalis]|nr:glycosyl transferase [Bifidobacterium animalis]